MNPQVNMAEITEEQIKAIKEESSFRATVLERLDNLFAKISEILLKVDDLNNRKADKTTITSFESIQTKLQNDVEDLKAKHEKFKDKYTIDRERMILVIKILGFIFGGVGIGWPIVYLYLAKYWV